VGQAVGGGVADGDDVDRVLLTSDLEPGSSGGGLKADP